MSEAEEHWAEFEAVLAKLRTVGDSLGECGQTCNAVGAHVIAGMIAGATIIVEELISWMEEQRKEQKGQSSGEEPS